MLAAVCEGPHGKIPHAQIDLYIQMSVQRARTGGLGSEQQGGTKSHSTYFSILNLTIASVYFASQHG